MSTRRNTSTKQWCVNTLPPSFFCEFSTSRETPTRHCEANAINSTFLPHSMNSLFLLGKPNQLKVFSNFPPSPPFEMGAGWWLPFLSSQNHKFVLSAVIDKLLTCAAPLLVVFFTGCRWENPLEHFLAPTSTFLCRSKKLWWRRKKPPERKVKKKTATKWCAAITFPLEQKSLPVCSNDAQGVM